MPPTTMPPETQAETTTENLTDARDNTSYPGERRDSFTEVLQAVAADNHKIFGDNYAGPSLPKRRWRSFSLDDLDDGKFLFGVQFL